MSLAFALDACLPPLPTPLPVRGRCCILSRAEGISAMYARVFCITFSLYSLLNQLRNHRHGHAPHSAGRLSCKFSSLRRLTPTPSCNRQHVATCSSRQCSRQQLRARVASSFRGVPQTVLHSENWFVVAIKTNERSIKRATLRSKSVALSRSLSPPLFRCLSRCKMLPADKQRCCTSARALQLHKQQFALKILHKQ